MGRPVIITHDRSGKILKEGDFIKNGAGDIGKVILTDDEIKPLKIEWAMPTEKIVNENFKYAVKQEPIDNVTQSSKKCINCGIIHAWYDNFFCRKCWKEFHN